MERSAWVPPADPVVGVVNEGVDDEWEDSLIDVIQDAGGTCVVGDLPGVLEAGPEILVTTDEPTLTAAVRRGVDGPVLPAGTDLVSTTRATLVDALERLLALGATVCQHPVLGVELDDEMVERKQDGVPGEQEHGPRERAIFDVTLATDEPALISEYGVSSRGRSVVRFRADGVVVATPVGSRGYAHRADGPLLSPALDAVAVVPIAPFETRPQRWVLPNERLSLSVLRTDDGPVTLSVDDWVVGPVDSTVTIGVVDVLSTLVVHPGNDRTNSDRNRSN